MSNELAIIPEIPLMDLGKVLAESGYFQDAKGAAQAIVKVLAGRELGFGPIASMTGFYIVKGKVTMSANLMGAAVKRSGKYNYRVTRLDNDGCSIAFYEGGKQVGESTLTMAEAKIAKMDQEWDKDAKAWKPKFTWQNFPRNMLFARTMSNGVKWFCPDVTGGPVYTPEELGEVIDGETGEISAKSPKSDSGKISVDYDGKPLDPGPDWSKYPPNSAGAKTMTDRPTPEQPAPVPDENAKSATLRFQPFVSWCNDWVLDARAAKYSKEHGEGEIAQANMYHILGRVGKLGFSEVNAENIEAIKAALQKHIEATA